MLDLDDLRRKSDRLNPLDKELLWQALSLRREASDLRSQNIILSSRLRLLEASIADLRSQRRDLLETIETLENRSVTIR